MEADTRPPEIWESGRDFSARFVAMPCSSKIEPSHVLKILEQGAKGVEVVGCPAGECRFLVGSTMAEKRVHYLRGLLEEAGLSSAQVGLSRVKSLTVAGLLELAVRRAEAVRCLGSMPGERSECA